MSDAEIVKEFLVESHESLDRLDQELVSLEERPDDRNTLSSIFRTLHTIKGTCGFLGFSSLESVTHAGESLLVQLRDGHLRLTPAITTALLQLVDVVRQILAGIEQTGNEEKRDDSALLETLKRLHRKEPPAESSQPQPAQSADSAARTPSLGELLVTQGAITQSDLDRALEKQSKGDQRPIGEILIEHGAVQPQVIREALSVQKVLRHESASRSTIRVDVALLDEMMNLVGELVLVRNQILEFTRTTEDSPLIAPSHRLNLTTRRLQEAVMKTRMQPVGSVWAKFPRTVRDIGRQCSKQVRIEMEGSDTELDRTIIEAIKDPLTHLIRNSVDHGIETSEVRVAAGKPPEGVISLRAFHEGAYVSIEIKDDGAGLDLERVRDKALRKGLITSDQASRMGEHEITNLIFLPGFSTAETVTNVSGRGVGMDVVKTNIEKIGGTVDIQSVPGQGMTLRMKIPLTLTIIPALIVTSAKSRYAVPQMSVHELIRLEGQQIRTRIEHVHGAPVYRLRDQLLPLVYLKEILGHSENPDVAVVDSDLDTQRTYSLHHDCVSHAQHFPVSSAADAQPCSLAVWIQQIGLKQFSAMAEMYELSRNDKAFHSLLASISAAREKGDDAQALRLIADLSRALARLKESLHLVENRMLDQRSVHIVVLQARERQFGLLIDEVADTAEIVVKPLNEQLEHLNLYSGATIMGDGEIVLILDSVGLAQRADVFHSASAPPGQLSKDKGVSKPAVVAPKRVVLVGYEQDQRLAIPMDSVARLEEFPPDVVEHSGGREHVQYRGEIMHLVRISDFFRHRRQPRRESTGSVSVVVCRSRDKSLGLVVDRILDVTDEDYELQQESSRKGILGRAVIQERVTEVLDVAAVAAALAALERGMSAHV